MWLTPREQEKLLVVVAADLAAKRRARGLKLNYPEAVALLTAYVFEAARDGKSVEEIMVAATNVLAQSEVMDGVAAMLREVQVEATFPDGTKLVTIHDPVGSSQDSNAPGEYLLATDDIILNAGKSMVQVKVRNRGDRPVQVGSHFHFYEVNPELDFDRDVAFGCRLAIPAGTAVRFEPGDSKTVHLVPFGGNRQVYGHRGAVQGALRPVNGSSQP